MCQSDITVSYSELHLCFNYNFTITLDRFISAELLAESETGTSAPKCLTSPVDSKFSRVPHTR